MAEYFLIAIALAMDAFAVSICNGSNIKFNLRYGLKIAFYFGFFQAFMPVLGWLGGIGISEIIKDFDHWVAFGLLAFIGSKMIIESRKDDSEKDCSQYLKTTTIFILAIATSIDALAVGITFSVLQIEIWVPILIIGLVTFVLAFLGVLIGNKFTKVISANKVEILGGVILIGIGTKILIEHLSN